LADSSGAVLAHAVTDEDGRVASLTDTDLSGVYRLTFDTASYFAAQAVAGFYPEVTISFEITDTAGKYHVPLLLSPYAYSTYRGS
jgi:5-hydroxyisourate hydrolase